MNMIAPGSLAQDFDFMGTIASAKQGTSAKQGVVVVVSDDPAMIANLSPVCEFLDLRMEVAANIQALHQVLHVHQPMAVIADVDGEEQDGFFTMASIARHSRDMPVMLLTGGDPTLMGAADAVQDLCGLTSVTLTSAFPLAGQLVGFLFSAGRRAGCMRLVPI